MSKLRQTLYSEFIAGRTAFDWCFLAAGLLLQVVVFCLSPSEPIVIVSGLAGIVNVVLSAQGKISSYFFGFIQVVTYLIICYDQRLYAEVGLNMYYLITIFAGIYAWRRRYRVNETTGSAELHTRQLSPWLWTSVIITVTLLSALSGWLLANYTNDSDPYLDAFTTVPAVAAQMLLIFGYREQWFIWFIIDLGCIWLWIRAGNWSMAALYAFWCLNCLRGLHHWTKMAKQ